MKITMLLAAIAGCATSASAVQSTSSVRDTSFQEADGSRVLQLSIVVDAPVADAWKAFTTDDGITRWAVPVGHITLGNDGTMESSYSLKGRIGDPDNIKNRIVAYLPQRLLVLHNEHVPKGAPFDPVAIGQIRTVIEFRASLHGKTQVTESQVGYGKGAAFNSLYEHFRSGNIEELTALAKSFDGHPVDWRAEAAKMEAAVHKPSP